LRQATPRLDILANILGEGRSSRLYQRLVHELKIAQSVSANHGSRMHGGSFEIAYSAMQGHTLAEIEKVIDDELDKLRAREPPTPEEIERARNQVKTDLLKGMEPLSGLATRLLYYDVFAGEPGYLRRDLERYDAATPEILGTWVKKILTKNARVVCHRRAQPQGAHHGPPDQSAGALRPASRRPSTAASRRSARPARSPRARLPTPPSAPRCPRRV
jgi:zinc protease